MSTIEIIVPIFPFGLRLSSKFTSRLSGLRAREALVESTATLCNSIKKLGSDPAKAIELAKKVNEIEGRIDKDYLATKKLFIKHGRQVDAGTLLILNNLIEFMEQAADVCADTADYINILASQG